MKNVSFKKSGRKDYMGFTWFKTYSDNKPVIKEGAHLAFHAIDEIHANKMFSQLESNGSK